MPEGLLETPLEWGALRYRRWQAQPVLAGAAPRRLPLRPPRCGCAGGRVGSPGRSGMRRASPQADVYRDVVMLHGLLGTSAQWRAAATGLGEDFRCWALELPGIGASARPRDLSLAGLTVWLEAACRALPLGERFVLMGSSWGGVLALNFAARSEQGARVEQLVLAAPAHPLWTPSRAQRFMLRPLPARAGAWLGARSSPGVHRAMLERIYGDQAKVMPESIAEYGATLRRPHLGAAVAGLARHFRADRRALAAALPQVTAPALLVWGDRDPVVPVATATALTAALPQAVLEILRGVGHLPFVEEPEVFAGLVRKWMP